MDIDFGKRDEPWIFYQETWIVDGFGVHCVWPLAHSLSISGLTGLARKRWV